jgi:hypothetical protein
VVVALLVLAGCRGDAARLSDENSRLGARVRELEVVGAQKDSLFNELVETTALVAEIDTRLSQLRGARPVVPREGAAAPPSREEVLAKIDSLAARLAAADSVLSRRQASTGGAAGGGGDATLRAQVETFKQRMAEFREQVDRQREEIERLSGQVRTLEGERRRLATANESLTETVTGLRERENTVFWIAGTRAQLLELGVIVEEGKRGRVLGIGPKRTPVPVVAGTLDEADFTAINLATDVALPLPKADRSYRILSPQDLRALEGGAPANNQVRGTLRIADPSKFWGPSKYLVLLEN